MEAKEKIEMLEKTVKQMIEEERGRSNVIMDEAGGRNTLVLLSKMLSQVESLKQDMLTQPQPPLFSANEEIMKEVREMKKQNSRTHMLLSIMIGVTLVWQLSEVSAILIIKQGLTHPFKSIGNMVSAIFGGGQHSLNELELEKDAANSSQVPQIYSFPGLKAPDIPHAD